jgi:UDP-N-acetylmuramate: L-alanyl-gamma-D-glutamyl-meso-diaminopimelate ligase
VVTKDGMAKRNTPFVVEGDEYDTAFFEKTPKFWHYRPEVGIVTSIEHDHVDIYPDEASYLAAFQGFVERIPESGLVVASAADKRVVDLVQRFARSEVAYFALEGDDTNGVAPHWLGAPAEVSSEGQTFDLYAGGVYAGRVAMTIPGRHNVRNALAAIAAAAQGYGAKLSTLFGALATFQGIRRRQDLLYEVRGVRVYDDFAHHPTAVDETIRAMRSKHPKGTMWAVFEPRSATACRALHQQEYARAFGAADRVVFAPLGRSEIAPSERLDLDALVNVLGASGTPSIAATSVEAIVDLIAREAVSGDTILLMSNGAFGGIYDKLRHALGS